MNGVVENSLTEVFAVLDPSSRATVITSLSQKLTQYSATQDCFDTAAALAEILSHFASISQAQNQDPLLAQAQKELLDFVTNAITLTELTNPARFLAIIKICQRHRWLIDAVLENCLCALQNYVKFSIAQPDSLFYSVADSEHVTVLDCNRACSNIDHRDCSEDALSRTLMVLKAYTWCLDISRNQIHEKIFSMLLTLLASTSSTISSSCFQTVLALSSSLHTHCSDTCLLNTSDLSTPMWEKLYELCSNPNVSHHRTIGYSTWASFICHHGRCFPPRSVFCQEQYWAALLTGLAHGNAQQKKACLYILKSSLTWLDGIDVDCISMTSNASVLPNIRYQYARYSTLFETIVLARYLNQVQECLAELTSLSQQEDRVIAVWLIALLAAALGQDMQDSIRKLLGTWIFHHGVNILRKAPQFIADFLEEAFLHWATLGYHFSSSVLFLSREDTVCSHGELLATFLEDLIASDIPSSSKTVIIHAVLRFIRDKGSQMYGFARVYVLEGLVKGVELAHIQLDEIAMKSITELSTCNTFNEIARDLMTLQCGWLASQSPDGVYQSRLIDPLHRACASLRKAPRSSMDCLHAIAILQNDGQLDEPLRGLSVRSEPIDEAEPISLFNKWIKNSRSRCLSGRGLQAALVYLLHSFDIHDSEIGNAEAVLFMLSAIWEQYEIQDHPKNAAMMIATVLLHPKCVKLCLSGSPLLALLSHAVLELQIAAQNRVHVLGPLCSALRTITLDLPEAASLPLIDFFVHFANHPPTTNIDFVLEAVIAPKMTRYTTSRSYESYYGKTQGYAFAAVFDMINKLPQTDCSFDTRQKMLHVLLDPWIHQKRPVPSVSPWKTTAQVQTMLILLEGLLPSPDTSPAEVEYYLDNYHKILAVETLPRFRYLFEWIITRIYVIRPEHRHNLLDILQGSDAASSRNTVSILKIASSIAHLPDIKEEFVFQLMTESTMLAASQKVAIRYEAQWTIPIMWTLSNARNWQLILTNAAFARLNEHIRSLDTYQNPPPGRLLEVFDPSQDHTLSNLFQGQYLDLEPAEGKIVDREDFIQLWNEDRMGGKMTRISGDVGLLPLGNPKPLNSTLTTSKTVSRTVKRTAPAPSSLAPLQTKATTWQEFALAVPDTEGNRTSTSRPNIKDVIVISSLIDNAYNIGGLSRVSEIFGVKSLQVSNLSVLGNKDFTSVSVSSHLWLTIEELKVVDMAQYLLQRKMEGYTVVGIEQTDSSKVLGEDNWEMPTKVVLVLGSEREGIPAWLLADMDICVEIKQVGITRSMNVQTAAAVVLYEHSRQHL